MFHNHPSGDPTPSGPDFKITHAVKDAFAMIGLELFDHIVLGRGRHHSMASYHEGGL
jgi:DNA repair protein RadC